MCPSSDPGQSAPRIVLEVDRADGGQDRIVSGVHSYTDNWYRLMGLIGNLGDSVTLEDPGGTDQTINADVTNTWDDGGSGARTRLAIGDSGATFSQSANNLAGPRDRTDVTNRSIVETDQLVRLSTSFGIQNSFTVRETGIFLAGIQNTSGTNFAALIERTVLDEPTDVVNGDTVSVTYELTWTAP